MTEPDSGASSIIIPFHNHWEFLRHCLWSVRSFTPEGYELILVDDGSDAFVRARAEEFARDLGDAVPFRLLRNERRQGFVKSCNRALELSRGDHVVLLNSDTLVTPGWLDKLVECARSDPRIGLASPLSNRASVFSVPIPMGMSFLDFARALDERSRAARPDVVTASGFCVLFTRRVLDEIGLLDETFGEGYGEETDYSLRALSRGFRVVAADDAFVWHCGRVTFGETARRRLLGRNKEILDRRWRHVYAPAWREYQRSRPLEYLRDLFPMPPLELGSDSLLAKFRMARGTFGLGFALAKTVRYLGARARLVARRRGARPRHPRLPSPASPRVSAPPDDRPSVTYLMWQLKQGGGSASIIQLVNRLTLLGWNAKIALTLQRDQSAILNQVHYTQPYFFDAPSDLIAGLPRADLYVATYWPTAYWARQLEERQANARTAYFVQDYEADFYPADDRADREAVLRSYDEVEHRIVKTRWLAGALAALGHDAHIIRAGLDLDVFYPLAGTRPSGPPRVLLASRRDERRGLAEGVKIVERMRRQVPDLHVVFFGADDPRDYVGRIPFPYEHTGPRTPYQMAELYRESHLLLDPSHWQGLGRTCLEAMACGCPCVATCHGGILDFARHGENALLADPRDLGRFAELGVRVLEDDALAAGLVEKGLETARTLSLDREASETSEHFLSLIARESARLEA